MNGPLPIAHCLLTAHHADDNIETLLMHFFRGTGLHGLTGIPEKTGHIRRPLLDFFKEELLDFARENKLEWVEDSSNLSSKYTRNYFRNELLPAIEKVYPKVKENLQDNILRFRDAEKLYRQSVDRLKKKLCHHKGAELHIPVKYLASFQNTGLVFELLRDYGFSEGQAGEVTKLFSSGSGHYIPSASGTHRIIRHRDWLIVSPVNEAESGILLVEESQVRGGTVSLSPGNLSATGKTLTTIRISREAHVPGNLPDSPLEACIDAGEIQFPLVFRRWKAGDYFYPLGMKKKKKKLARFLIDQKLSLPEKEQVWVLESGRRIVWVVGYRIDERFRITENTRQALRLRLTAD